MNHKILSGTVWMSIVGAILVSTGQPFWANVVWSISNPILLYHNYQIKEKEQTGLFLVFTIIALFGVWNLFPR